MPGRDAYLDGLLALLWQILGGGIPKSVFL